MTIEISHLPDELVVNDDVTLRLKTKKSYEDFARIVVDNVEHLSQWLPWAINAPDESSIEHYELAAKRKENNESVDWDIYVSGELAGAIGIMQRDPNRAVLEIGYWLAENQTGKGIISTCVNKIVDLVFEQTTAPLIEIGADIKNLKSRAVPERTGFTYDREFQDNPNSPHVELGVFYSLTREQWEENKSPN